jgi:ABC-type multidrug transport system ATPase subunit
MLQKLAVARALLAEPPLLLLDEPTRSLDDAAVEFLWSALDRRPRAAVLIATHRRDDLARCDRELDLARA